MSKGLLGYYNLLDWFYSLSEEEQEKLRKYSRMGLWIGKNNKAGDELTETNINFTSRSKDGWLSDMGLNAAHNKDFGFAEKILLKAIEVGTPDSLDRHFVYINLIKLFDNKRYLNDDKCICYCLEDISWIEKHTELTRENLDFEAIDLVSFPSIVDIYMEKGYFDKAKEICERAIKIGYWKEYFEDKIRLLQVEAKQKQ
jgi:tetratricopeptide (TPR) repeat protein